MTTDRDGHCIDGGPSDSRTIETAIRAGAAVFNAGHYHAAHDAWEDYWLDLEQGADDERFLHGLIQFTAAAHHASNDRREGALGLAESALEYLADLGTTYRDVDLEPVRTYLEGIQAACNVGAVRVPPLRVAEDRIHPEHLTGDAADIAETLIANDH